MRNISFALTTAQVRDRSKTVSRRLGWWDTELDVPRVKVGDLLQPVEKGQGLKKGEKAVKVGGPIRVVDIALERLGVLTNPHMEAYARNEVIKEGFPKLTPQQFVTFFMTANKCSADQIVTRIAFEYVEEPNG